MLFMEDIFKVVKITSNGLLQSKSMNNKNSKPTSRENSNKQGVIIDNPSALSEYLSDRISLKMLQFLEVEMQPHVKKFNIIEIALLTDKFIDERVLKFSKQPEERLIISATVPFQKPPKLQKVTSSGQARALQLQKQQIFHLLLQQLKKVFIFYSTTSLCYQMLNEYVYNQQLTILSNQQVDEDYMEIGQKRVRIDENVKLCIMPLIEQQSKVKSTKIKELVFRQNPKGSELESIYAVTNQYIRCIRIKPELIGIASDFNKNGANNFCWYHFEKEVISPKRNTISVLTKTDENPILSSAELKQLKATNATNLQEMFSDQLLNILKACLGDKMMGMISLDQSFLVEPISNVKGKVTQGYIGNLVRDIPPQIAISENSKEKYQQILLFHAYSDTQWLILTDKFLYFYRIPHPSQNIILNKQNNLNRAKNFLENPLMLLCQRLPSGCIKAMVLNKPFVCLMMKNNSLIIIKVVINSVGIFQGKTLNIALNYYKITNKIYNDIQFRTMSFNSTYNNIFASDFGAYLIKMAFNKGYGDIQQEGITYNKAQSSNLNQQMMKNSYNELKVSRAGAKRSKVIHQVDGEDDNQEDEEYIQVFYIKSNKNNEKNLFSIYKKQNTSPHTVVIKNKTRQVITFLATNHNYNTLVTYESQSYQKVSGTDFDGEKYREWGNNNKIKLWDIRHMTIYKTYDISVQIAFLQLRANGLFAVTTDRGYLVYYPFNEDRKAMISESQQKQLDLKSKEVTQQLQDLFLHKNSLYFSTLTTSYNKFSNLKIQKTHIYQLQLQKIPQIKLIQVLPSQATALALNTRLYILQNSTQGVEASQLHIYNKAGLKQDIIIFSNLENVGLDGKINTQYYNQQYKFLKKIEHTQFQVVLWNADAMKLIGANRQSSYTVVFSSHKVNNFGQGIQRIRNIKDIQIIGQIMIVYCQHTLRIKEKASHLQTNSKLSGSTQRRSNFKEKVNKVHEHFQSSVILFNNQNDRISFRLEHISSKLKVLHMYNSLLLTKEDSKDYDMIKLLDVGQSGSLHQKTLFAVKYKRIVVEKIKAIDLKDSDFYKIQDHKNIILQEAKQYNVKHMITLEDTLVAITSTNKLIVLLIFKVQAHYSDIITRKVVRSQLQFMIYARNISDQLFNNNYKISKIQIGKKTQKHLYEYQTSTTRSENIFGHKLLSIDDCFNISNYSEINMQGLCQTMESEQTQKYSGVDITEKILAPKHINNNRVKDVYQILSLRKDQKLFNIFEKQSNTVNAINSFTFKIIQFSDDDLKGVISISNKHMKTITLYTFEIDCIRQSHARTQEISEPYRLLLNLSKISLLEVKSHKQIKIEEQLRRSDPQLSKKQIHHVRIHQWNEQYKSEVEEMWENTLINIKKFIYMQKQSISQNKRSISLPPINLQKLNTLQIKKKELLKKKISTSQRTPVNSEIFYNKMEADGASIMFKKWGISQAIAMQNSVRDANNNTEIKAVNRYVSKVLKSEQDTIERVDQLIKNTQQIKQSLMQSPEGRGRVKTLRTQQDQYYNNRSLGQEEIQRIIVSSQIAKQSSIKSFMKQKAALRSTANQSKNDNYKLVRNDTNKSELTSQMEKLTMNPSESRNSKFDIRATNQSKLSNNTNLTFKTLKNSDNRDKGQSVSGLEYSISKRLQQIQERSLSKNKTDEKMKFYTPQRQLKGQNIASLRTEKSQDESELSSDRKKTIRFSTEQSPIFTGKHKKDSHSEYTLKMISEQLIHSPIKSRSKKQEKFQEYKNNFSIMNHKQLNLKKEAELVKRERIQTDSQTTKESAIERLKKSKQMLKDVYLPEIFANKEKLMKKMKQKRSFVKTIQTHLNQSSLQTIHDGQQRRQLIRKLSQLK